MNHTEKEVYEIPHIEIIALSTEDIMSASDEAFEIEDELEI